MQEVTNFVDVFGKHIKKVISGSLLASLFRDVVYLCDGLSILHCNIYFLLHPVMVSAVEELMQQYWSVVRDEFVGQVNSSLFWMKSVYTQNVFKLKSRDTFLLYCNEKKEELLPGYLLEVPVLAKLARREPPPPLSRADPFGNYYARALIAAADAAALTLIVRALTPSFAQLAKGGSAAPR